MSVSPSRIVERRRVGEAADEARRWPRPGSRRITRNAATRGSTAVADAAPRLVLRDELARGARIPTWSIRASRARTSASRSPSSTSTSRKPPFLRSSRDARASVVGDRRRAGPRPVQVAPECRAAAARELAVAPVVDQLEQERALVGEVVVERADADAGALGDVRHRRRLVAEPREERLRRVEHAPTRREAARLGAARTRRPDLRRHTGTCPDATRAQDPTTTSDLAEKPQWNRAVGFITESERSLPFRACIRLSVRLSLARRPASSAAGSLEGTRVTVLVRTLVLRLLQAAALLSLPLCAASRPPRCETEDGKVALHGSFDMQLRWLSDDFDANDWYMSQWANTLNLELELNLFPDGIGPFDVLSGFVRVEARYECVFTGCGIGGTHRWFGDRAHHAPARNWRDGITTGFVNNTPNAQLARAHPRRQHSNLLTLDVVAAAPAALRPRRDERRRNLRAGARRSLRVQGVRHDARRGRLPDGPLEHREPRPADRRAAHASRTCTLGLPMRPAIGETIKGKHGAEGLYVPSDQLLRHLDDFDDFDVRTSPRRSSRGTTARARTSTS